MVKHSNVVTIIDPKTQETVKYYVDPRLKDNIEQKVIHALDKRDKDYLLCIDGQEGCQPKGSKILMSDGTFKNIEQIKIGDRIISPQQDGTTKFGKIVKLFSFKAKEIYDVYELHRQKKLLYSCSDNHYIPMNEKDNKTKKWGIVHYQAKDFFTKSKTDFHNTTTPTCFSIDKFEGKQNCLIEPYTLGVWLGDGHFSYKHEIIKNENYGKSSKVKAHYRNFCSGKVIFQKEHYAKHNLKEYLSKLNRDVGITCNLLDVKIMEEVSKFYQIMNIQGKKDSNSKTYRFSIYGELANQLIKYNLQGKGSGEKFIPKEALTSDIEYRKRLLAGLIDTDGHLSRSSSYSITTKSEQLAKDIEFLVYSLGGRSSIHKIKKGIKKIRFIGEYYRVSFYIGDMKLPQKVERKIKKGNIFYLSANRKSIKLKKRDGEQVYGFTVDTNSHWYVTDNFVITRNSGKSTLALQIGKLADPTLTLSRVVFNAEDFRSAIIKAKKKQCVIYDEAFTGLSSRASLSGINRALVSLMMQMRQKNLFIILVLPTFFLLDKYAALFRAKTLIHVYENKGIRGYFRVYSKKLKKLLYLYGKKDYTYPRNIHTKFKGRFYGVFALGGEKVEQKYREMKAKALEETQKNPMSSSQVKFREQRDVILYLLRKTNTLTYQEIANLLLDYDIEMSYVQVSRICAKYGDKTSIHDLREQNITVLPEKKGKLPKGSDFRDIYPSGDEIYPKIEEIYPENEENYTFSDKSNGEVEENEVNEGINMEKHGK